MIKCYLSHQIRGEKDDKATKEDMDANNAEAIKVGSFIRDYFWRGINPYVDIYIPAEHEDVILYLYEKGYITEKQILEADCNVIKQCDLLLVYKNHTLSKGMTTEVNFAAENGIDIFYFSDLEDSTLEALKMMITAIAKEKNGTKKI